MLLLNAGGLGMHPLLAPACFCNAWRSFDDRQGWTGQPSVAVSCALILAINRPEVQLTTLRSLAELAPHRWVVLTPKSNKHSAIVGWLKSNAVQIQTFAKGSLILQQRGAWRRATLKTRQTPFDWVLWAARELQSGPHHYELDHHGIPPTSFVSVEDRLYGPMSKYYNRQGVIAATDGSVQEDGAMGAAATAIDAVFDDQIVGINGKGSSTTAEMVGLSLAVEVSPNDQQLTVFTDSLSSLQNLQRRQRKDFTKLDPNPHIASILNKLVDLLNNKVANGLEIMLVKVKGHSGDPLNERADWLANQAATLDPTVECCDDDRYACRVRLMGDDGEPKKWSARMAQRLIQIAAETSLCKRFLAPTGERARQNWQPKLSRTLAWMLWADASRSSLGQVIKQADRTLQLKRFMQTISGTYPTTLNLKRWGLSPTDKCPLCGLQTETMAHIQCLCPALKNARIAVHHQIWAQILCSMQAGFSAANAQYSIAPEATVLWTATHSNPRQLATGHTKNWGYSRFETTRFGDYFFWPPRLSIEMPYQSVGLLGIEPT